MEDAVQAERNSMVSTHESQELVVPSPSPTQSSPTHSLSPLGADGPGSPSGPVNAITVLTLLDKLVNMLDTVQENQHKMESRQAEMEGAVRGIQSDMTKLSRSHSSTSNTVSKLLEKSRKVSVHMKEVKEKMDRQAVQVKKLEANHAYLLNRNNFKVLIFQDENEIPSSVFVKEPVPFPREAEGETHDNRSQDEALQNITLSSDEELGPDEEEEEAESLHELGGEHIERSRAEKIKRSSLKKVDSLKKAFSRQNIEKKMNKIVSQEQREKLKKSLTPSHQKSSSFKVSPLSFSLRKSREVEDPTEGDTSTHPEGSPGARASIELAPISSPDEDHSFTEVHSQLDPTSEETKATADALEKDDQSDKAEGDLSVSAAKADLSAAEDLSPEYALSATLPQDDAQMAPPSSDQEEEEEHKESHPNPS